jgi:hypothetical protein
LDFEPIPLAVNSIYTSGSDDCDMNPFIRPPFLPSTPDLAPSYSPFLPETTKSFHENEDQLQQETLNIPIFSSETPQWTKSLLHPQQEQLMVPVSLTPFTPPEGRPTRTNVTPTHLSASSKSQQERPNATPSPRRTRKLQSDQWNDRFQDLLKFQQDHGHMFVPNNYPSNPPLSQWVKRNRYQYKLKQAGKHSTISEEREAALNAVGFVWDSHASFWQQRLQDLKQFAMKHGHCNIPTSYHDVSLSLWCKHQRRQYNRLCRGHCSTMTPERFQALQALGFDWNPRNMKPK